MAVEDAHAEAKLHDETLKELGLSEQPFLEDKKRQRFADSTTQKTRAALEQHLRFGDSLHLLIGDTGAGKTVLLSQLIKHCKSSIKPFVVKGSEEFQAEAFLAAVLHQLDGEPADSINEHIDLLIPQFQQITDDQYSVVLVVDDAHLAPLDEVAALIDMMHQFESDDGKIARLLLTGKPSLKNAITTIENQFEEIDLNYSTNLVPSMDNDRVREYLSSRLNQAGHANAFPFTDKAIAKIQRDSGGLPGKINTEASQYLNGVYRGDAAAKTGAGLFGNVGWPAVAMGAAALGLIGWGLSLFFGNNDQNTDIVQIPSETTVSGTLPDSSGDSSGNTVVKPVTNGEIINDSVALESTDEQGNGTGDLMLPVESTINTQANTQTIAETNLISSSDTDGNNQVVIDKPAITTEPVEQAEQSLVVESLDNPGLQPELQQEQQIGPSPSETVAETSVTDTSKIISERTVPGSAAVDTDQLVEELMELDSTVSNTETGIVDEAASQLEGTVVNIDNIVIENPQATQGVEVVVDDTDAAAVAPTEGRLVPNPPAIERAIENERWVLFQSPTKFTIQLATSRERSYIIDLAKTMEVTDPVAIYPFFTTDSQNPVFGLLSGLYETRSEAIAAVESMSEDAKKFGVWIRPVSDLQDDIKRRQ